MPSTLSGTYATGVTLTSAAANPTTITAAARLNAGLEVSAAGLTLVTGGRIKAASSNDGVVLDAGASVTNQSSGTIAGYYAIDSRSGATTVVNAGSIAGGNTGIYLHASNLNQQSSITNLASAVITGGVLGVASQGAPLTLLNAGSISAFEGIGANLYAGGAITNQSGATIAGISAGGALTVVNAGKITSSTLTSGIVLNAGGIITNQGTGSIRGGVDGIYAHGTSNAATTVVNAGTIAGSNTNTIAAGIVLGAGGSITNQSKSVISGHDGVYITGGSATILNQGTISGTIGIAFAASDGANQTVINAGVIIGSKGTAVAFSGTGSNLLVLESGFTATGTLVGSASATNTVQLVGNVTTPVTATYSSHGLVNFQTVAFGPGAANDATLVITSNTQRPATIAGFSNPLDTIVLSALLDTANNATTRFNASTDVLTVTAGTTSVNLQLDQENYTNITFIAQKATGGGTQVQALPPPTVTSVTTSPATGTLGAGKTVTFTVNFSENVTVTGGVPTLLLNDGGTARYTGGSGKNALTFVYTVVAGQSTPDLTVTGTALNGATLGNGPGNTANLAGAVTNPAGTLQINAAPTPTPTPAPGSTLYVDDPTTNVLNPATPGSAYSGSFTGVLHEYITATSDSLYITTSSPGWFIRTQAGNDSINVSKGGGNNVLDASTGSAFLVGGSGKDTFYIDARAPTSDIWSTIAGFHSGDSATIWGIKPSDFTITHLDNQGAAGATGLTFSFAASGQPHSNLTIAGYSGADLSNGHLTISYGSVPSAGSIPGSTYMLIHAN